MKTWWLVILLGCLCFLPSHAQETVTLSTPVITTASGAVMRPARVELNVLLGTVTVSVYPWVAGAFVTTGPALNVVYDASTTPTGASLIVALNKANLSTISLERRIINQLIASGHLTGTVSGTVP